MELIYASLLLHAAKQPIDEEHLTKVLSAAGAKVEPEKIKALVASLEGVNIEDVISKATLPVAAPAAPATEKKEKKEEKEEKKAEEAAAGLSALFG